MSFKALEGDTVLLMQGGIYKTADLYEMDGALFAKWSGGFIRLKENGTTSKDGVNFYNITSDRPLFRDKFGRICVAEHKGTPLQLELKSDI